MGNESSALVQRQTDTAPPSMVLSIDALVIPPPEQGEPVLVWNRREDETPRETPTPIASPKRIIQSGSCSVIVRLDNKELDAGNVSKFPSGLIPINAKSWSAVLEIQFFASSWGPKPWSALCAPLSKLIRFGAPLYTSLWLGLDTLDEGPSSERSSYSDSTSADLSLKGALARAHVHHVPKVRITLFRPDSLDSPKAKPSLDGVFHSASSDVSGSPHKLRDSSAHQVDGLIRCLDESNALIHTFYESVVLATLREDCTKKLQEMREAYKLAEEKFFVDAEELAAKVEQLRLQHAETLTGHEKAVFNQREQHEENLKAKHIEREELRQAIEARVEDHHRHLQNLANEQLQVYAKRPGLEDSLTDAHGDLQAELAQNLSQLTETWKCRINDVHVEQEQQLSAQRDMSRAALVREQAEIERLTSEHAALQGELVKLQVDHADDTKRTQVQREELSAQLAEAMATAERDFEEHQSSVELAQRSHKTETEALRAALDAHQRQHEGGVAQVHARHAVQHASLVAKHRAEHDRCTTEAVENHELQLREMQAQREEQLRRHEAVEQTHQQQITDHKNDLEEKERMTRERLAEAAKWQAEVQKLHSELNDMYAHGQRQEEERRQLVHERQTRLETSRQALVLAQLQGACTTAEKQRAHAEELHRVVQAHTGTLSDYQAKRDALRVQMRSIDDEATKTCDAVVQEFKTKLTEIAEAFQVSHQAQSDVEEQSLEALVAEEAEATRKLAEVDAARMSEVAFLQEAIESYAAASEKEHAELKDRLESIKVETAAAEAKVVEDARKKLDVHAASLHTAHSSQAEQFSQEVRRAREQRETTRAEAQRVFDLQKHDLDAEAKRLRDEVKDLADLRAKNACKVLELERIRKSQAAETEHRSNAGPGIINICAKLEACRAELSSTRHRLSNAEEMQRNSLQELYDLKEAQADELAGLAAEVEATVSAASAERTALQDSLDKERASASKLRLQTLSNLEERYEPALIDLRKRVEYNRQEIQAQQLLVTRAIAELRSTAGDDLKAALDAKSRALAELTRTKDDILRVRAQLEEASAQRRLDADTAMKSAEETAKHQLVLHDQSVTDELVIQAERRASELLHLKQMHEEERRHLQKIAQDHEIQLTELQHKLGNLDTEVSRRADGIPKLKSEWTACIESREKELREHTEKHTSLLAEERVQTAEHHDRLRKEAAEQHKGLAQQVKERNLEASKLQAGIKALQASMDQEALEFLKDADEASQTITQLHAKVRAAEEQVQNEREKGRQKHLDMQQEVSSLENEHERFAYSVLEKHQQLQVEIGDHQKQLELTAIQQERARADLERQRQDHELKRQRELHMRQLSFEHDHSTRGLEHKAHIETLTSEHRATVDELVNAHESQQQEHFNKLAALRNCILELEPCHQAAEALGTQIQETRDRLAELKKEHQSEALQHSLERQQKRADLVTAHIEELKKDRLRFEESFQEHDLELERSQGDLQRRMIEAYEGHDQHFLRGSDLEGLRQQADMLAAVHREGSDHPQAVDVRKSIEQEFAETITQRIEVVQREMEEMLFRAREGAQEASRLERERNSAAGEEKLSQAQAELTTLREQFQAQIKDNEAAHRERVEAVRQQVSHDAALVATVQLDLEQQLSAAEEVARKFKADAASMRQTHQLELSRLGENERATIEELKLQEKEAEREFMLEAEEVRKVGEATIQEMRDERLRRVEVVRREATCDTERRNEGLKAKIKRDTWMAQQASTDLQRRFERADKRMDETFKYRQGGPRRESAFMRTNSRGSVLPAGRRGSVPESSADPLDDTLNRMALQLFCRLLAEKYASVVPDQINRSFEKLQPDFAGQIKSSPADLAVEVARLLRSKKQCSIREAFLRLDPKQTGKVLDSELEMSLQEAFGLDPETRGHITFLIESAAKLLRNVQNGAVRTGESCMSEQEFVKVFEDVRLGLVAIG